MQGNQQAVKVAVASFPNPVHEQKPVTPAFHCENHVTPLFVSGGAGMPAVGLPLGQHPPAPAPFTLATPPKTMTQSCSGSGTAKVGSRKKAAGKAITSVGSFGDKGAVRFSNSGRSNAQSSLHPQTGDSLWDPGSRSLRMWDRSGQWQGRPATAGCLLRAKPIHTQAAAAFPAR